MTWDPAGKSKSGYAIRSRIHRSTNRRVFQEALSNQTEGAFVSVSEGFEVLKGAVKMVADGKFLPVSRFRETALLKGGRPWHGFCVVASVISSGDGKRA